jgi:hypothetical protein
LTLIFRSLLELLALATKDDEFSMLKDTFKFTLQYSRRVDEVYQPLPCPPHLLVGLYGHTLKL